MDVPQSGVFRRSDLTADVAVAKFDTYLGADGATQTLPDLAAMQAPVRVRILPAQRRRDMEAVELADASGDHVYRAEREKPDNNYVVVVRSGVDEEGRPLFSVLPVTEWYKFERQEAAPRSAEEQVELFDRLQRLRERDTAAAVARRRLREEHLHAEDGSGGGGGEGGGEGSGGGGRGRSGGGGGGGGGLHSLRLDGGAGSSGGPESDYRAIFSHEYLQAKARGNNAGGNNMGNDVRADDLEDAYRLIDDGVEDGADADAARGAAGRFADFGEGGDRGLEFDVLGAEGEAEERAIDYEAEFGDDAGDGGAHEEAEDAVAAVGDGADEVDGENAIKDAIELDLVAASAGVGLGMDGDDEDAVGLMDVYGMEGDEDMGELQKRLGESAAAVIAGSGGAVAGAKREREGGDSAEDHTRSAKRAKLVEAVEAAAEGLAAGESGDVLTTVRVRMQRLFVAMGGRITTRAVTREFGSELRADKKLMATISSVLKALARPAKSATGDEEWVLKS